MLPHSSFEALCPKQSVMFWFQNFSVSKLFYFLDDFSFGIKRIWYKKVSDSVSKKFGIEKSVGFDIVKIWYRDKYRTQYQKNLVSKKVLDSVSFRFWVSSHTATGTAFDKYQVLEF